MSGPDSTSSSRPRALSNVFGITIIIAITIILVSVAGVTFLNFGSETQAVHGTGTYEFGVVEQGSDRLQVWPQSVQSRDTTFVMEINGYRAFEWDGTGKIDINCVYAGDKVDIYTEKGDSRYPVQSYRLDRGTDCKLSAIDEKIQYALIQTEGMSKPKKVQINEFKFDISIDPQGPGPESSGHNPHKNRIGKIPMTNDWNYVRRYDRPVEGLKPPVWVIVMTDNVHWTKPASQFGGSKSLAKLNWTDNPPGDPGQNSYSLSSGGDLNPIKSGTEPTNDIYIVFKPGCTQSTLKVVEVTAGYTNWLYLDGNPIIRDTSKYRGTSNIVTKKVSGVDCPTAP